MLPFDDMPKRSRDPRDPYAVAVALRSAPLPALQLAEALQALGGRASRSELFEFLDTEAPAEAEEALRWLIDHAIVRGRIPDLLEGEPGIASCFVNPLGLGPPLSSLFDGLTVDTLRRILRELGQSLPKSKADLLAAFTEFLRDPDAVRATLASAPSQVQSWLVQRAVGGSRADPVGWSRYDQDAYRLRQTATGWAVTRGLLIRDQWAYLDHMPAEVARALRGPQYRAPFCPHPPSVSTHTVSAENLSRGSAASAGAFSAAAIAILDRVSRTGVPLLKSGGIGARELAKLSKSTGSADPEVRLVLELAERAGLLDIYGDDAVVSESFAPWRTGEPSARYRDLVLAWRHFGAVPTEARSEGKALPVLRRVAECTGCVDGRIALLTTLSRLPPGCGGQLTDVGAATRWHRPLVCFETEGDSAPFAATWREAEALGVVSQGALSAVGRLVLAADRAA